MATGGGARIEILTLSVCSHVWTFDFNARHCALPMGALPLIMIQRNAARLAAFIFGLLLISSTARSEIPCDFKGVSVGDKLTPDQLMQKLGIAKFLIDPTSASFDTMKPLYDKYGVTGASELEDWNMGPYCIDEYCRIPWGVTVGNNGIPVSVFVSIHSGVITEIDVSFGAIHWDDVMPIIEKKYGQLWKFDQSKIVVTDYETNKSDLFEFISAENRQIGVNKDTKDTCHMSATNIDIVFTHHDPLGSLHSIFMIKLDSKNF